MRKYYLIGIIIGLIFLSAAGCQKEAAEATLPPTTESGEPIPKLLPPGADVKIGRSFFDPITTEIQKGATVTWKNMDDKPHMVRIVGTTIGSPRLEPGDTWEMEFDEPGSYEIIELFYGFKGYVEVSE